MESFFQVLKSSSLQLSNWCQQQHRKRIFFLHLFIYAQERWREKIGILLVFNANLAGEVTYLPDWCVCQLISKHISFSWTKFLRCVAFAEVTWWPWPEPCDNWDSSSRTQRTQRTIVSRSDTRYSCSFCKEFPLILREFISFLFWAENTQEQSFLAATLWGVNNSVASQHISESKLLF